MLPQMTSRILGKVLLKRLLLRHWQIPYTNLITTSVGYESLAQIEVQVVEKWNNFKANFNALYVTYIICNVKYQNRKCAVAP